MDASIGSLRIRLLGPFGIEGVDGGRLGSRKARTLLKILALARGKPVSVDRLADCLWGDVAPARPADQISVLVSRLRAVLGAERLVRTDAGYALVYDWLDLDAMDDLAVEARRRMPGYGARVAATAGLALVRGPFLADEPDAPWAEAERAAAGRTESRLRHTAAEAALEAGDWAEAATHAYAALDLDPYDEVALRLVMAAHACGGRPASALAVYAEARERLAEDLGVSPSEAVEEMHTTILMEKPLAWAEPAARGLPGGERSAERRWPNPAGGDPSLVGRADTLDALDAALARVVTGGLEVVLVEGEAGMGKSAVLGAFARRAAADGAVVLAGACDEAARALPLQVVADALEAHIAAIGADRANAVLGPDALVLAPLVGHRPRADPPAPTPTATAIDDPGLARVHLFGALLDVLARVAGDGRAVLVLDDLHLAGAATVEFLSFAARRGRSVPLLVVAGRRPEEALDLSASTTLVLGPLDLAASGALVGVERAAALHGRAAGNPLFLLELAAAADSAGDLPASLREAVAARCRRSGPAGSTLVAAAVVGAEIDTDVLGAVLRLAPVELLDHLEEGVRRRFLVERGGGFVFAHELVRQALAAGAGAGRRALIHREAARALADRPDGDPLALAHHARQAGDDEMAAFALARAAGLAAARFDTVQAEELLDQAIGLGDRAALRVQRARIRIARGAYAEAAADAVAALGTGAGAEALEVAGWAAYYRRDFATARRLADDGARLAGDDDAVAASCLALGGRTRMADGDLAGAGNRLDRAAALATGAAAIVPMVWLGALRIHQDRPSECLELTETAALPGIASAHPFATVHALQGRGQAFALLGRIPEALAALDAMDAESERRGLVRFAGRAANYRAWMARNLGRGDEADDGNRQAYEAATAVGEGEPRVHALLDLADGRLRAGDLDAAAATLARARPLQDEVATMRWRHELRAALLRSRLSLAAGAAEEALAEAFAVAEDAAAIGVSRYVALAQVVETKARAAAGLGVEPDAVAGLAERLITVAGLEAWWLVAELAAATASDGLWARAGAEVARMAGGAGEWSDGFVSHAGVTFSRLRAGRVSGRPGRS